MPNQTMPDLCNGSRNLKQMPQHKHKHKHITMPDTPQQRRNTSEDAGKVMSGKGKDKCQVMSGKGKDKCYIGDRGVTEPSGD
jgi:hypothetical protein